MKEFSITYTHRESVEIEGSQIHVRLITIDNSRIPAKSLRLVLDTGAFISIINKDIADLNGYKIFAEKACVIAGFSEKGLICDLRKIPSAIFCNHRIEDVIIATPHDRIPVTEVLGTNILENFHLGIDFADEKIFTRKRGKFTSEKPKYQSGNVTIFNENDFPWRRK
ncbi:MAG: hypothetical protein FWB96_13310 [Defluviitaleaceae bacterium]|nr:hypothetical protein [Defluviitaleaceae bacterium]MCL2264239.1 hypothetical protein [Defluviitaleaceae bacterium]